MKKQSSEHCSTKLRGCCSSSRCLHERWKSVFNSNTHTESARQQFGLVRLLASANFDGGVRHTVASVVECSTSAAAVVLCSFAGGGGVLSSASVSVSVSSKTGLASFAFLSPPHSLSVLSCQCTLLKVLLELQLSTQQKTPSEPFADCAKRPSLGGKAPQN